MWTFTLQVTCMTSCHSRLLPCEESSPGWVSWSLFLRDALCSFGAIIFLSSPCEWSLGLPAGLLEQLMTCVCCPSFNLIKICHQIAPEGEDGRVCSLGPDWPQPLAKLPEALTEASLGLGQWDGFVTVLLPQADGLSSAWHGQGTQWGALRGQFYKNASSHNQSLTLQCPSTCSWRVLELLSFNILLLGSIWIKF